MTSPRRVVQTPVQMRCVLLASLVTLFLPVATLPVSADETTPPAHNKTGATAQSSTSAKSSSKSATSKHSGSAVSKSSADSSHGAKKRAIAKKSTGKKSTKSAKSPHHGTIDHSPDKYSAMAFQAGPLAVMAKNYRDAPTASGQAALEAYAKSHPKDPNGALAEMALGVTALNRKDYPSAVRYLQSAQPRLPQLSDYIAFYIASAREQSAEAAEAADVLEPLRALPNLLSPISARAAILEAKALLEKPAPADALKILTEGYEALPQPDADSLIAQAHDALNDGSHAAIYYQKVYFSYPATEAAAQASAALDRLQRSLGGAYPTPMPSQMLLRADRWMLARNYLKARLEFESLVPQLGGTERDTAQVRAGEARHLGGDHSGALLYLKALEIPKSDVDAERLYYLGESARSINARSINDDEAVERALHDLARKYPASLWRQKLLLAAANRPLVKNDVSEYVPLYKAAYEGFPADANTAFAHWKVTWASYLAKKSDTEELLREQVARYPFDFRAATALYFLGRMEESGAHYSTAKLYYSKLNTEFPNTWYGLLGRERLQEARIAAAVLEDGAAAKSTAWLETVAFPQKRAIPDDPPSSDTQKRITRARMLTAAGFPDWAETELRFGAKYDEQPHLLAMELAALSPPHIALRQMKSLVPDYLQVGFADAPIRFWHLLYPLPFKESLLESAQRQNLDPYVVAGLIRQESEFNPGVISHANAYGLTQVVPATGRMLARQEGLHAFSAQSLLKPEVNLRLGTRYLRALLDQWGGKWEETLASYNAGKSRVDLWLSWHDYREPAEFVESIPFNETRDYVQAVLRNAAMYRKIYGQASAELTANHSPGRQSSKLAKHQDGTAGPEGSSTEAARAVVPTNPQ